MDSSAPTDYFGVYTLYERIGVGGMATVYRGVHNETGQEVALKRLLPQLAEDAGAIRQFIREAEIAKALSHPNIVAVEDSGRVGKEHFLAMEYLRGQSLLQLLRQANAHKQPAPIGVAVWVLHEILSALDYAMTGLDEDGEPFNIVHRDLSPSNIIMTTDGEIKIIDLGVAKSLHGRYATTSGRIKGKLGYMSPEVLAGRKIDQRSDLFSTAIVIWELLTATRLYRGSEKEQLDLRAINHEQTPPSSKNRWVPPELDRIISIALSEHPRGRWHTAGIMLDALRPVIDDQAGGASTASLVKWVRTLTVGKGVLDSTKTNHLIRLDELPSTPIPRSETALAGVSRFPDKAATRVDPMPFPESALDEEDSQEKAITKDTDLNGPFEKTANVEADSILDGTYEGTAHEETDDYEVIIQKVSIES